MSARWWRQCLHGAVRDRSERAATWVCSSAASALLRRPCSASWPASVNTRRRIPTNRCGCQTTPATGGDCRSSSTWRCVAAPFCPAAAPPAPPTRPPHPHKWRIPQARQWEDLLRASRGRRRPGRPLAGRRTLEVDCEGAPRWRGSLRELEAEVRALCETGLVVILRRRRLCYCCCFCR